MSELQKCSYPNCEIDLGVFETDLGPMCGLHMQHAKDIMRGEDRLIAAEAKIAALEAKLAACEWKPITPSYLPKYGDEVGTASAGKIIEVADAYCTPDERFDGWLTSDYTHFRAINPFAARNEAGRG
jgi:hypothetical protein